jgi:hypothetical protein
MAKFITVTLDNINEEITLNTDKIVTFSRRPNLNFTTIDLDGKESILVKETPPQIMKKLVA